MQLCGSLSILWHCLSLGLEWKLTFSSPVATAEFSKFAGIECSTFTASSFRIWNSSTGIPSPPLALFVVMTASIRLLNSDIQVKFCSSLLTGENLMSETRWAHSSSFFLMGTDTPLIRINCYFTLINAWEAISFVVSFWVHFLSGFLWPFFL